MDTFLLPITGQSVSWAEMPAHGCPKIGFRVRCGACPAIRVELIPSL